MGFFCKRTIYFGVFLFILIKIGSVQSSKPQYGGSYYDPYYDDDYGSSESDVLNNRLCNFYLNHIHNYKTHEESNNNIQHDVEKGSSEADGDGVFEKFSNTILNIASEEAKNKLEEATKKLEEAKNKLEEVEKKLDGAKKELVEAKKKLEEKKNQIQEINRELWWFGNKNLIFIIAGTLLGLNLLAFVFVTCCICNPTCFLAKGQSTSSKIQAKSKPTTTFIRGGRQGYPKGDLV